MTELECPKCGKVSKMGYIGDKLNFCFQKCGHEVEVSWEELIEY